MLPGDRMIEVFVECMPTVKFNELLGLVEREISHDSTIQAAISAMDRQKEKHLVVISFFPIEYHE